MPICARLLQRKAKGKLCTQIVNHESVRDRVEKQKESSEYKNCKS